MKLRPPPMLASAFLVLAALYCTVYTAVVWTNPAAANSRFEALRKGGYPSLARSYGERVLKLQRKGGVSEEELAPLKTKLAQTMVDSGRYERGAELYEDALKSDWANGISEVERAILEDRLARARLFSRDVTKAVSVYSEFLDLSGDATSRGAPGDDHSMETFYASLINASGALFTETLKPTGNPELFRGARDSRLIAANDMTKIGGYFALSDKGLYAAAGLLSSAYGIRRDVLGPEDRETLQIAVMLGPVYQRMGRLEDSEKLYLDAFHAEEKAKGSNNPELSLYIKLLAGVYEAQGRATEAQALYEHLRALFRDAYGAQRYAANRQNNRKLAINRPVSQAYPLPASYAPTDLVAAARYTIPLSKSDGAEEMTLRLAPDPDADPREANFPARLALLISLCSGENGERISLRSGYRSYKTQKELFARIGYKGTVTPPGVSEHQLGLVADLDVNGRLMRQSDRAYQCVEENSFRYGFILSYPPGNKYLPGADTYEPWHWRYVGIRTARLYREAGPHNRPQEFLGALSCYEERAAAGGFAVAGENDVCLDKPKPVKAASNEDKRPETGKPVAPAIAARKLNNSPRGGQR